MGLMLIEYLMERRSRLEDILKQSEWGNSPPNPKHGKSRKENADKLLQKYIFLNSYIHFNRCVMLL